MAPVRSVDLSGKNENSDGRAVHHFFFLSSAKSPPAEEEKRPKVFPHCPPFYMQRPSMHYQERHDLNNKNSPYNKDADDPVLTACHYHLAVCLHQKQFFCRQYLQNRVTVQYLH